MKINHYKVIAIVSILLTIAGLSWLSYTISDFLKKKGSEKNEKNENVHVITVSSVLVCRLYCCKDVK